VELARGVGVPRSGPSPSSRRSTRWKPSPWPPD